MTFGDLSFGTPTPRTRAERRSALKGSRRRKGVAVATGASVLFGGVQLFTAAPASVGTFVPVPAAKPGRVVPGVRAKVGVDGPSSVQVTGTLVYGAGKARQVDLGPRGYQGTGGRNLRFAIPAATRSDLPLGTTVRVSLAVSATPDSAKGCTTHGAVTHRVKLKIVKVLSTPQAGVS